jgi:hypothetical protein
LLLLCLLPCSAKTVTNSGKRQKVIDALAKNVFLVDPRQVSSAAVTQTWSAAAECGIQLLQLLTV